MAAKGITLTEGKYKGEALQWEQDSYYSRSSGTIPAGTGKVEPETVLGMISIDISAVPVPDADNANTGNGTATVAGFAAGVQAGVYNLECVGGTFAVSRSADAGNTGDGVMTLASPAHVSGAQAGVYRVLCIEPAGNGGRFAVFDPAGVHIGTAVVGSAFSNQIAFTIADGATDFVAGDAISVTVANSVPANGGKFKLVAPDGTVVSSNITVGVAFTGGHLNLTVADGSTDFVVGDKFAITVPAVTSNKYVPFDPAAMNGAAVPKAVLFEGVDATTIAQDVAVFVRHCVFKKGKLNWKSGLTTNQKNAALAILERDNGIIAREMLKEF